MLIGFFSKYIFSFVYFKTVLDTGSHVVWGDLELLSMHLNFKHRCLNCLPKTAVHLQSSFHLLKLRLYTNQTCHSPCPNT